MKFKFCYDEFGLLDVKATSQFRLIAWFLTDENYTEGIDEVLNEIKKIKINGGEWEMSYNKSFLNLNSVRARCGDLYHEDDYIDVDIDRFVKILKAWRSFITKKGKKSQSIDI